MEKTGKKSFKTSPPRDLVTGREGLPSGFTWWLLRAKARNGFRSPHFWIIAVFFIILTYVYYGVLTEYHDIYIIIYLYPQVYAAVVYRMKGVIVSAVVLLAVLFPGALVFNFDVFAMTRTLLFDLFAFIGTGLGATLLNYVEHEIESYEEILNLNDELNKYIRELKQAQQQLIHAARLSSIGELAAAVAHELNNPLAGVLVYTRLIKDKLSREAFDREQVKGQLQKIESAIDYCTGIIRGLLDFARQSPPVLGPVTVHRAIDKAMALVGHQALMKNIQVVRRETEALPLVVADFNQLVQVFVNLVVNAIQAMKEGNTLTIRSSAENGWVKVDVQDTGTGISPENMEKLFTPFFTTKDEVKGVGLGLAVSHGIVERHGGKIQVESELGKGSTFSVLLPAYKEGGALPAAGDTRADRKANDGR
jgi:signal transduction histidine kinase